MVGALFAVYITPAGITQLMAGEKPTSKEGGGSGDSSSRKPLADASMSYESLNKFVIKIKAKSDEEGEMVLRRRGINWKLTEILIPLKI